MWPIPIATGLFKVQKKAQNWAILLHFSRFLWWNFFKLCIGTELITKEILKRKKHGAVHTEKKLFEIFSIYEIKRRYSIVFLKNVSLKFDLNLLKVKKNFTKDILKNWHFALSESSTRVQFQSLLRLMDIYYC